MCDFRPNLKDKGEIHAEFRSYGQGQRIKLGFTRAMVKAVLSGALKDAPTKPDPVFGIAVPLSCPGVPDEIMNPRNSWKDKAAYDRKARELAVMFEKNFAENASDASAEIKEAGPKQLGSL